MKNILLVCATLFFCFSLIGQRNKRCAFKEIQAEAEAHPDYQKLLNYKKEIAKNYKFNKTDTVIYIPVVVHVIYRLASENISTAQINSQIDVLNKDFRKLNADTTNVAAGFSKSDVKFEFVLALIDPNGNPTSGITRTSTTEDDICNSTKYFNLVPAWNRNRYLNIWVCDVGDFNLGFAYPPNTPNVSAQEDGIVIGTRYFGTVGNVESPYNKGRTTTHEIGHFFDLMHPWGNDQNPSCSTDDGIADTPNQDEEVYGCPPSRTSCGSADMLSNFLGYIDDACMGNFTLGQKDAMRMALYTQRDSLQYGGLLGLVSIKEVNLLERTTIHPNPSNSNFNFSFPKEIDKKQLILTVFDISGRKIDFSRIFTANGFTLELKNAQSGIYFVQIHSNEKSFTKKLIKQ